MEKMENRKDVGGKRKRKSLLWLPRSSWFKMDETQAGHHNMLHTELCKALQWLIPGPLQVCRLRIVEKDDFW